MIGKLRDTRQRFIKSFKNPIVRRNVAILMAGKMIGLVIALFIMMTLFPEAAVHAQDGATDTSIARINAVNTVWTLIAAFLVFGMQAGFVMLEAGFARSREAVNILVEGIADTCICGITFWLWGFAFMFGTGSHL